MIGNVKINGKKRKTEEKGVKCSVTKDFLVTSAHTHFPHHDKKLLLADPNTVFLPSQLSLILGSVHHQIAHVLCHTSFFRLN